jgi:hypothetical protein
MYCLNNNGAPETSALECITLAQNTLSLLVCLLFHANYDANTAYDTAYSIHHTIQHTVQHGIRPPHTPYAILDPCARTPMRRSMTSCRTGYCRIDAPMRHGARGPMDTRRTPNALCAITSLLVRRWCAVY